MCCPMIGRGIVAGLRVSGQRIVNRAGDRRLARRIQPDERAVIAHPDVIGRQIEQAHIGELGLITQVRCSQIALAQAADGISTSTRATGLMASIISRWVFHSGGYNTGKAMITASSGSHCAGRRIG